MIQHSRKKTLLSLFIISVEQNLLIQACTQTVQQTRARAHSGCNFFWNTACNKVEAASSPDTTVSFYVGDVVRKGYNDAYII